MWKIIRCLVCLCFFLNAALGAKLPSTLKKCPKKDNNCMRAAIEDGIHQLRNGYPELKVPSIDPITLPSLTVDHEGTGPVNVAQHYSDLEVYGYSDIKVKKAEIDWENKKIRIEAFFPKLTQKSQYHMNGKILLLPVEGEGYSELTLYDIEIVDTFDFDVITKNKKDYIKITNNKLTFDVKKATYRFDNLFNGNKKLGDPLNKLLNDNWKDIFDDVKEGYENAYGLINKEYATQVLSKVPISDLFTNG